MSKGIRRALHLGAAAAVVVAVLGLGTDPAHAQPLEEEFTDPGPWADITYDNGNTGQCDVNTAPGQDYTFIYPSAIGYGGADHPIVVYGVGTSEDPDPVCAYKPMLEHFASWGFVVVSPNDGMVGDGTALVDAANEIVSLNSDPASPFYDNLDTSNIATAGHSQGAGGSVNAAIDSNLITAVHPTSMPSEGFWSTPFPDLGDLDVPVFFARGTDFWDNWWSSESANQGFFNAVSGPAAKATVCGDEWDLPGNDCSDGDGSSHFDLSNALGYSTAWFLYTLADGAYDSDDVFTGSSPEIATNGGWENWQSKNLP